MSSDPNQVSPKAKSARSRLSLIWLLGAAAGLLTLGYAWTNPETQAADPLGPLFAHPYQPNRVLHVGLFLLAALAAAAAVVAVIRGRAPMVLGTAGLFLLPAFSYVIGNVMVIEESKEVEFCGSCHATMGPVVEAMRSDTDTLASIHYRNGRVSQVEACYDCHSGYGIWGDFTAKKAGVMHMVNTVTGDYDLPLTHRGQFAIASCLNCHAKSVKFRDSLMHQDPEIQEALLSGEIGCAGTCHVAAHPPEALNGALQSQ